MLNVKFRGFRNYAYNFGKLFTLSRTSMFAHSSYVVVDYFCLKRSKCYNR